MTERAVLFPGQGAQTAGMGQDLYEAVPACRALFDEANEVLGYDLAHVCFEGPQDELTRSAHAQPGIFLVSVACYRALEQRMPGLSFSVSAGLSSGEWTALHLAGVISFADTLRVLQARGTYMQEACVEAPGGMLSIIGLDLAACERVAEAAGIEVANLNSPAQTVLSGPAAGIAAAEKLANEAGAKRAIPLDVAGAFHSRLMAGAADKLAAFLAEIELSPPSSRVVANVTGGPHGDVESIRTAMVRQVTGSVQWVRGMQWMQGQGVRAYLECGPGKVLTGLAKRIDKAATLHNIQDHASLEETCKVLAGIEEGHDHGIV